MSQIMTPALRQPQQIRTFASGGCGLNIVQSLMAGPRNVDTLATMATLLPAYLDTSYSDVHTGTPKDLIFHLNDAGDASISHDGGGKIQSFNNDSIRDSIELVIGRFPPTRFNILVSSASGSSGCVFTLHLAAKLLDMGVTPIIILIGTTLSSLEKRNTARTIEKFRELAAAYEKPVPIYYIENGNGRSMSEVDKLAQGMISHLAVMLSGMNQRLDTQDFVSFFDYTRSSSIVPPTAVLIDSGAQDKLGDSSLISRVRLLKPGVDPTPFMAEDEAKGLVYHSLGFYPDTLFGTLAKVSDARSVDAFQLCMYVGYFTKLEKQLRDKANSEDSRQKAFSRDAMPTAVSKRSIGF